MIEIRRLTPETASLLWTVEDRRLDSERVVVRPQVGGFGLSYRALPNALWRVGNAEQRLPRETAHWLDSPERAIYFAWLGEKLAGQIAVQLADNNLAAVLDVRVGMAERRRGVGEALLDMAEGWAKGHGRGGLVAETQDGNAGACQFLGSCGFQLGGIDTLRYAGRSQETLAAAGLRESALFFYRFMR